MHPQVELPSQERRWQTINFFFMILALLSSAFFSGSETALTSVRRIKLEVWLKNGRRGAKQALAFIQHPEQFLTTTLVGTNIATVTASALMVVYLEPYLSGIIITVITSMLLLIFGEILPKTVAREKSAILTLRFTNVLRVVYIILFPIIWTVIKISRFLLIILGLESLSMKNIFTRKDLDMLMRESEQFGLVDKYKRYIISRLILKGNQKTRDIMIPRTEITAVKSRESIPEAFQIFESTGYSRLPVMKKNIDEIIGMITVKDLLLEKPDRLKQILRDLLFVPHTRLIASLLREMQQKGMGMAIVVDEYGGTAGLVTIEDIVEEFVGEIQDEFDGETRLYRKIAPMQIDANARVEIAELNERFGLHLPRGNFNTLGGLIMDTLGRIPKKGERIELPTCMLVILSAFKKKINWVRISIKSTH